MMKRSEPNSNWKNRGVDQVVLLEPQDLLEPSVRRIEMLGYEIGAVVNQGSGQVIVIQLPGSGKDAQLAFPVLELDEALSDISRRWRNAH